MNVYPFLRILTTKPRIKTPRLPEILSMAVSRGELSCFMPEKLVRFEDSQVEAFGYGCMVQPQNRSHKLNASRC